MSIRELNGEETFLLMCEIGQRLCPNIKSIIDRAIFNDGQFSDEQVLNAVINDLYGFNPLRGKS